MFLKKSNNGFLLVKITILMSISLIILTSLVNQLMSLKKIIYYKNQHRKAFLAATSGLNIAPLFFHEIPYVINVGTKQWVYNQYENGFVKKISQTNFSLLKSDQHILSIYKQGQFRCILQADYAITTNNIEIKNIMYFKEN